MTCADPFAPQRNAFPYASGVPFMPIRGHRLLAFFSTDRVTSFQRFCGHIIAERPLNRMSPSGQVGKKSGPDAVGKVVRPHPGPTAIELSPPTGTHRIFSLSLRSGERAGERGFLCHLRGPPLPGPPLHFVEEREKSPSDLTSVVLIQWQCTPALSPRRGCSLSNRRKRPTGGDSGCAR